MRVLFPQEIYDETDRLLPYMEFDQKEGWHLKNDAPPEIVDRYNQLEKRKKEIIALAM